jgi:hypothetical protein
MDVIKFSQKTKQEADELLKYGSVIKVLSKYGKVVFTGSYKYDLMYGPDIDLVVLTDNPDKASFDVFLDFIKQRKFQKYQLGDFKKFSRKGRPKAIIVVLIHEYKGRRWEIEIWFKKSLSENDTYFEKLISKATEKQRKTILELKHQRKVAGISKYKLDSAKIYKGFLTEGKVNIEDF